jgi:hypothetical protein
LRDRRSDFAAAGRVNAGLGAPWRDQIQADRLKVDVTADAAQQRRGQQSGPSSPRRRSRVGHPVVASRSCALALGARFKVTRCADRKID